MNVAIISGRYPATSFDSVINHKIYADKYGYTYIHCNWPTAAKNFYHNKIYFLLQYIDHFDYLIWIDDDAFFFDLEKDIMTYAPVEDSILSFCKSPTFKQIHTYLSSGQFVIKSCDLSKYFLNKVLLANLNEIKLWWREELGYFSNGDQDAIVYILLTDPAFIGRYNLYDYKEFNSRPENIFSKDKHLPFVLHFTGMPHVKQSNYLKVQKYCNLHSSLLHASHLKGYNIIYKKKKQNKTVRKVLTKLRSWLSH